MKETGQKHSILKKSAPKNSSHIKWDEPQLSELGNHPPYQKIDEPKTPYHRPNMSLDSEEECGMDIEPSPEDMQVQDDLENATVNCHKNSGHKHNLQALNAALTKQMQANGWCSQEEESQQDKQKHRKFNQMRDNHYANEYTKANGDQDSDK